MVQQHISSILMYIISKFDGTQYPPFGASTLLESSDLSPIEKMWNDMTEYDNMAEQQFCEEDWSKVNSQL